MYGDEKVREVLGLAELGHSKAEIARRAGVSRATVREWIAHQADPHLLRKRHGGSSQGQCLGNCGSHLDVDEPGYAYLLGQYLGDGCISQVRTTFRLRIMCCDAYPGIMEEVADAIRRVKTGGRVGFMQRIGCTEVSSYWLHWPCLLPHGGGGVKHLRPIEVTDWQRRIALDGHPARFVRGLIHSDGWRGTNRVRGANGQPYAYPRYQFSNRSREIRDLFVEVCDRLGVSSRQMNSHNISVARRESVAILDQLVGLKY